MELLARHSDGVIALSGCLASRASRRIVDGRLADARAHLDDLVHAFGPENVYFEIQRNGIAEQEQVNEAIVKFAREMGRPLVATADVHYLRREDYHHHAALLCVQTKSTLAAPKMSFDTNEFYLKSSDEMAQSFSDFPEALASTLEIAERCDVSIELGGQLIPRFETPNGEPEGEYLRALVGDGLRLRYGDPIPAEARERADMELGVIDKMGFNAYFLIVHDFVAYAKDNGHRGRPGPRLGGGLDRRLLPRDHRRRPAPLRPAVRALPQRRARVDARHRHRLLRARPRARDPLRDRRSTAPTASRRSSRSARCSRARPRATPRACSATSTRSATGSRS